MRRTEQLQGLRLMKFEDVYGRCYRGDLSQAEASEILGMSERTFRRWRERYEAEGAEGLYDRRLGRVSAHRAPVDEVMRVLELFETRYPDFTAKHFHEKLVCEHGFGLSYNWLRLSLQAHGKIKPAPRRGAHRRKLSLPFIPSIAETLEFCITTAYPFGHALDHRNLRGPRGAPHRNPCPATAGSCPETEKAPAIASEGG